MNFNNMMGFTNPLWATLCLLLLIFLIIGVVLTIVGIVKYFEDNKNKQLMIWGIIILVVSLLVWGVTVSVGSNYFINSNQDSENTNMMDN